jgi:hypothetical protein
MIKEALPPPLQISAVTTERNDKRGFASLKNQEAAGN